MALDSNTLYNDLNGNLYNQIIDLFNDMERRAKDDETNNEYTKEMYARELAKRIAREVSDSVVQHIINYADVKVDIPLSGTIENFTAGSGSNGGSLSGTGYNGFQVLINGSVKLGNTSSTGYEGKATIS